MSQQKRETLSALFDGEVSEFEMRRLLSEMDADDVQQWRRYQLLRDGCQKNDGLSHYQFDISAQVAQGIAQEQVTVAQANKKQWQKPFIGFASAAAFAFVAVFGVQQWQLQNEQTTGFVAEGNVSASQLPINSSPGLSTASAKSTAFVIEKPADKKEDKDKLEDEVQK